MKNNNLNFCNYLIILYTYETRTTGTKRPQKMHPTNQREHWFGPPCNVQSWHSGNVICYNGRRQNDSEEVMRSSKPGHKAELSSCLNKNAPYGSVMIKNREAMFRSAASTTSPERVNVSTHWVKFAYFQPSIQISGIVESEWTHLTAIKLPFSVTMNFINYYSCRSG